MQMISRCLLPHHIYFKQLLWLYCMYNLGYILLLIIIIHIFSKQGGESLLWV